jgi:hypothetical protein
MNKNDFCSFCKKIKKTLLSMLSVAYVEFLSCWGKKGIFKDNGTRRRVVLFGKGSWKKNERTNGFLFTQLG